MNIILCDGRATSSINQAYCRNSRLLVLTLMYYTGASIENKGSLFQDPFFKRFDPKLCYFLKKELTCADAVCRY